MAILKIARKQTTPRPIEKKARGKRGPRKAGRPSANEASLLEKAIVESALAEFRTQGLAGASIEQIAKAARCTRAVIYRKFGSKDILFQHVIERQIQLLKDSAIDVSRQSENPMDALKATVQAYAEYVVSAVALDLQRILIWEAGAGRSSRLLKLPVPSDLVAPVERLIAAAQAARQIKPGPPKVWAEVLLRLVAEGPRWQALASGKAWTPAEAKADFERMWPVFLQCASQQSPQRTAR